MSVVTRLAVLLVVAGAVLAMPSKPADAATVNVQASAYWFCNSSYYAGVCETTINVGDTVTWNYTGGIYALSHTTTECGGNSCNDPKPATPLWDSGVVTPGGSYPFTFTQPGVYLYQCQVHTTQMRGQITVVAVAGVGGIAELPQVAGTPLAQPEASDSNVGVVAAIAAGVAAGAAALGGAAWYVRRRWPL